MSVPFDELTASIRDQIREAIAPIQTGIIALHGDMVEVKGRLTGLEHKVDGLDRRVGSLEHKVDGLDRRVGSLEHKVDGLDRRVGSLESKVTDLERGVGALDGKVGGLNRRVGKLAHQVDGLEDRMDVAEDGAYNASLFEERADAPVPIEGPREVTHGSGMFSNPIAWRSRPLIDLPED